MATANFPAFLTFVWAPGRDCPSDGCHTTPGDSGGTTNAGVTQATWANAERVGIVTGPLERASQAQLREVLRATCWEPYGDSLPSGLDLLVANGRMMTGDYTHLVQQCCGLLGADVDGWIGPQTLARIHAAEPRTLIDACSGVHFGYLTHLPGWSQFGAGWGKRVAAAQAQALGMAGGGVL
jgi:lysozyme family protein